MTIGSDPLLLRDPLQALSAAQCSILSIELARDDLSCFTVVRMARKDIAAGNFDAGMARLRVDLDKIRTMSPVLAEFVRI